MARASEVLVLFFHDLQGTGPRHALTSVLEALMVHGLLRQRAGREAW